MSGVPAQGAQTALGSGMSFVARSSDIMLSCIKCTHGDNVTVVFQDTASTFHAQWLHDAQCDNGAAARNAVTAICQQPITNVHIENVQLSGEGPNMTLDVAWDDNLRSKFPGFWLRVMAPLVGRSERVHLPKRLHSIPMEYVSSKGWLDDAFKVPEISYQAIFPRGSKKEELSNQVILRVLNELLDVSSPGIVKIVDLPEQNLKDERKPKNNFSTLALKRLFGSVSIYGIRGTDQTFNVSSDSKDAERAVGVAHYETTQPVLPYSHHSFYDNPDQIQGFYGLEGQIETTWVYILTALETFWDEFPNLYHYLLDIPMTIGRILRFDGDPLYQATVDPPITREPWFPNLIKRVRWNPNLTGALLAPYNDYKEARLAHQRFQEIMRRDTHQLKLVIKPGDLYIWNNFRVLHGLERVLEAPRKGIGQTVPERDVHDRYRALHVDMLKRHVDEAWLVHMPMPQLREMLRRIEAYWVDEEVG